MWILAFENNWDWVSFFHAYANSVKQQRATAFTGLVIL